MNRLSVGIQRLGRQECQRCSGGDCLRRGTQLEGGTDTEFAFDVNLSGVFLHDAIADCQTEAGAFVLALLRLGLGGEKGIVDAVEMLALDSAAGVLDAYEYATGGVEVAMRRVALGVPNIASFAFSMRLRMTCWSLPWFPWMCASCGSRLDFDTDLGCLELMFE